MRRFLPTRSLIRFAQDSALEQAGFELYVPPSLGSRSLGGAGASGSARQDRRRHRRSPERRLFASTNLAANFRECLARLHMDKTGFEREIGFGGFEHLAAPSSPSRQRRGLSGRSHLSSKQMPKKWPRADSLMREKISLIARFNSLQGLKKFPVRMRRELAHKALS